MRNPRIYTPQPLPLQTEIVLEDSAANHIGRVLRMKTGEPLILFNGKRSAFQGKITAITKRQVTVVLETAIEGNSESPLHIELGQVISRGERMDYAVQKATEMGITDITPLFSERCEVKLNAERQEKRIRHWQQVAISACEQCGRTKVPVIHQPSTVESWLKNRTTELNFVLHHRTARKLAGYEQPASVSLLIGPEGGLTADEIEQAEQHNFNALSLGPRILRTETAPVAAASILHYLWGDYR